MPPFYKWSISYCVRCTYDNVNYEKKNLVKNFLIVNKKVSYSTSHLVKVVQYQEFPHFIMVKGDFGHFFLHTQSKYCVESCRFLKGLFERLNVGKNTFDIY